MLAHPEPLDYGRKLSVFDDIDLELDESIFQTDYSDLYQPTYDIPTSFFRQQPKVAPNGSFEINGMPYVLDGQEIFIDNGLRNYKLKALPVIVEKEKDVYLKKTSSFMARLDLMKKVTNWKKQGYEIYLDVNGQYYKYAKEGTSARFDFKDISPPKIEIDLPKFEWKQGRDFTYKRTPLFDKGIPIGEQLIGYLVIIVICVIVSNGIVKVFTNMLSSL